MRNSSKNFRLIVYFWNCFVDILILSMKTRLHGVLFHYIESFHYWLSCNYDEGK